MIYNDSQLFAITRAHYLTTEELEDKQPMTMQEKQAHLVALGYTVEEDKEEVKAPATPLKIRNGSEVIKDGVSYFVKESYIWTRSANMKTICWTITKDKEASGEGLQPGLLSAKTLKQLKIYLANDNFKKK